MQDVKFSEGDEIECTLERYQSTDLKMDEWVTLTHVRLHRPEAQEGETILVVFRGRPGDDTIPPLTSRFRAKIDDSGFVLARKDFRRAIYALYNIEFVPSSPVRPLRPIPPRLLFDD